MSGVGCMIGPQMVNLLAYADDLVLLAPSWRPMQHLLSVQHSEISSLDLTCNKKKSVFYGLPYVIGQTIYIFIMFLSSSFFSSPNLSGWRLDVCHTSTHGVALVRI